MKALLVHTIIILLCFGGLANAQVANKTTKKVYIPKSVKNFTGGGKIDQTKVPKGTKEKPTYIRLWKGKFTIADLEGYVNIIAEPGTNIYSLYSSFKKMNVSLYVKNGAKVNIAYIMDKGLDTIYLERLVKVKTRSGLFSSIGSDNPIPEKVKARMKRYDQITTYGEGNLKEFYNTYTTVSSYSMPKYELGAFKGKDCKWEKYEGRDIYLYFNYKPSDEQFYISLSTKYSARHQGYKVGNPEWMYVDGKNYKMRRNSAGITINSHTKDFIKIGKISYAILEWNKIKSRQYFDPQLVVDLRPLKADMAKRKREEAIEAEKKRKRLAKQAKIEAHNANPNNWRMGDRVCLKVIGSVFGLGVVNQKQPIRAVIEFFNKDRSRVKVKILESRYNGTIDGEEISKGNLIWITPQVTYRGNSKWMLCK